MRWKTIHILAAALLIGPVPAYAVVIYDWTGTCGSGCITATGVLQLDDAYVPGTVADVEPEGSTFSPVFTITITRQFDAYTATFDTWYLRSQIFLPEESSLQGGITMRAQWPEVGVFETLGGTDIWEASFGIVGARGIASTFTLRASTVPEPSTFALFGLGLLGLGFARRRA